MYLDGIWLKRSWGGEVKNVAVLVAIGVREDGYPLTRASSWMRTLTDTTPGQVRTMEEWAVVAAKHRAGANSGNVHSSAELAVKTLDGR